MVGCAVVSCKNNSSKATKCRSGVTYHKFPQDERRRRAWEIAVNREPEWVPSVSSKVCSQHFEVKQFYYTEKGLRKLCREAVPTINISVCQEKQPTIAEEPHINPTDTVEVIQLKRKVRRLQVIAKNRMKTINTLWQSRRRIQIKMEQMKAVLEHLLQGEHSIGKHLMKTS